MFGRAKSLGVRRLQSWCGFEAQNGIFLRKMKRVFNVIFGCSTTILGVKNCETHTGCGFLRINSLSKKFFPDEEKIE